jgi:hypothetical protein
MSRSAPGHRAIKPPVIGLKKAKTPRAEETSLNQFDGELRLKKIEPTVRAGDVRDHRGSRGAELTKCF